jgi:hypothetical protein
MNAEKRLLPIASSQNDRRLEVQVAHDEAGRRQVVLQDLSWGSGVGWYVQKTLRLDPEHVEALLGALCCARQQSAADPALPQESTCLALKSGPLQEGPLQTRPLGSEAGCAQVIPLENFLRRS